MEEFDLIIIGSGAGLNLVDAALNKGMKVALVESGPLGGTCLNRGCIPSKVWTYPADIVRDMEEGNRLGIRSRLEGVDFDVIRKRTWEVVLRDRKNIEDAVRQDPRLRFFNVTAGFVGDHALRVGDSSIRSPQIVIAAGARTLIPAIPGLQDVPYKLSENIFEIASLPKSIILLGGGYKSCEFAHFFSAMGVKVSIIQRNVRLLPEQEPEIGYVVEKKLGEHVSISTGQTIVEVRMSGDEVEVVKKDQDSGLVEMERAEMLFLGTGMKSNAPDLNVQATGVRTDARGYVIVNEFLETSAPGIWALGDITGKHMFRHTANYESQVVWYNMNNKVKAQVDEHAIPSAVYTYPTVGKVGLTEAEVKSKGISYLVGFAKYSDVAKGNAMGDDYGLVKILVEKGTMQILGAHIAGKQADLLVQQITYLMNAEDGSYRPMGRSQVIHPSLSEVLIKALNHLHDPSVPPHAHDQ
ncbi:MAG: Dihydrolipoyl dehydrogenase [Methanomassiliicoccales archaeon PtaU1.Bin030]|nr:MAG: Dihydrolipoyl dehydrogenase [Methanomassiliicoccales archaeon PtaU1.Bin030]